MNKRMKWAMVLATITVFVTTAAFLPGLVRAGNLEPSAPPGSTMHTLEEIYEKVSLQGYPHAPVAKTGQTRPSADMDDGDLQKGVAWPNPRFTDHGDGTVTDNLTGLMWTKNANLFGPRGWVRAISECASCVAGDYSDWRLPNVRELYSLIDYGQYNPALPAGHPFSNVQSSYYWSSTSYVGYTGFAWLVLVGLGYVNASDKYDSGGVWCVRGGE